MYTKKFDRLTKDWSLYRDGEGTSAARAVSGIGRRWSWRIGRSGRHSKADGSPSGESSRGG